MTKETESIHFTAPIEVIRTSTIARLPEDASKLLPSRGQVAVIGEVNDNEFQTVLEPDGYWGHWMRMSDSLLKVTGVHSGDTVTVDLRVTKDWPEPDVPKDFAEALKAAPQKVKDKWQDITPMARWEWIRWVNATGNPDTRTIRLEKTVSKLNGKHRRPCCFNLAACTDPELSKSGRLVEAE